jgi:hypothetical protein
VDGVDAASDYFALFDTLMQTLTSALVE